MDRNIYILLSILVCCNQKNSSSKNILGNFISIIYLLYLAYKIATAEHLKTDKAPKHKPMTFLQAAAFQWVNPKAWVMAVGAISTYTPLQGYFSNVWIIAAVFALINAPTVSIWAGFGSLLRTVLRNPRWLRVFNGSMALLLVLSLYPLLFEH